VTVDMFLRRSPFLVCVIWAMVGLSIWVGWPSTGCVCADGGFKLFCSGHKHNDLADLSGESGEASGDCCDRHNTAVHDTLTNRDCCDPCPVESQITRQGCRPVVNEPVVVAPASKILSTDHSVAFDGLPVDRAPSLASYLTARLNRIDTGPPTDLVISLHCLLI